jgi:hypothetical protein
MPDKKTNKLNLMQTVAMVAAIIGAIGSLYFMFKTGRNQKSILLIVLFTGWVLSPFAGLFLASKFSNRWIIPGRLSLYWLMIIFAIGSLVAYSGVLIPSGTKGAFIFLVAPFTSWIVITIVFLINRIRATRSKGSAKEINH